MSTVLHELLLQLSVWAAALPRTAPAWGHSTAYSPSETHCSNMCFPRATVPARKTAPAWAPLQVAAFFRTYLLHALHFYFILFPTQPLHSPTSKELKVCSHALVIDLFKASVSALFHRTYFVALGPNIL